jgi:gamma-glutamyltranspeptidase
VTGAHSITVPGAVAGWEALGRWGRLGLEAALRPAIAGARSGVAVAPGVARALRDRASELRGDEGMSTTFYPNGRALKKGDLLVQTALGETLERIATEGAAALYGGAIGAMLVRDLRRLGCSLEEADLERHEALVGSPLVGRYRDWEIATASPNSQGYVLLQGLAVLERLGVAPDPLGRDAPLMAAAFAPVNGERDRFLSDPRVTDVEFSFLLEPEHIDSVAAQVLRDEVTEDRRYARASGDTVAVVTADAEGWAVTLIQSLFHSFGSGILQPATGIICHNRGASFSLRDQSPNLVAPWKRPAHTLMPVVVSKDGRLLAAAGAMGGKAQPQIHAHG